MDLVNKAVKSFMEQGIIGWGIALSILIVVINGRLKENKIKKTYNELLLNFRNSDRVKNKKNKETEERIIENDILNSIITDFKNSAKRGTENINTEVIIQKRIGTKIVDSERKMKIYSSVSIALGLLGTFLGLTIAIVDTKEVIGGIESMAQFSEKMAGPFSSMSSAFWTSICGVIGSLILNKSNVNVENAKEAFYDSIEDYLDNIIYPIYAKNFNNQFEEFNKTIRESMINLTKDMRDLFKGGVEKLVNKINKNTIDLTSMVNELNNYTKDLDRLTNNLNKAVDNFKEPVDKFKVSVYDYTTIAEDLTVNMKESINKFAVKVDLLDNNLTNLYNSVDCNKRELVEISSMLKTESNRLKDSYEKVGDAINLLTDNSIKNTDELKEQINNLNKGYEKFDSGLVQFVQNLESLQVKISDGIVRTLDGEMNSLTNNIVDKLNNSMSEIASATEQLTKNTISIGEVVKASNDLWSSINKVNS